MLISICIFSAIALIVLWYVVNRKPKPISKVKNLIPPPPLKDADFTREYRNNIPRAVAPKIPDRKRSSESEYSNGGNTSNYSSEDSVPTFPSFDESNSSPSNSDGFSYGGGDFGGGGAGSSYDDSGSSSSYDSGSSDSSPSFD